MLQELFTRVFQAPPYIPACWIKEGERSLTWQSADWSLALPICPWHQNLTVRKRLCVSVCVLISDLPATCVVGCTCYSVVFIDLLFFSLFCCFPYQFTILYHCHCLWISDLLLHFSMHSFLHHVRNLQQLKYYKCCCFIWLRWKMYFIYIYMTKWDEKVFSLYVIVSLLLP